MSVFVPRRFLLLLAAVGLGCAAEPTPATPTPTAAGPCAPWSFGGSPPVEDPPHPWWRDAVVYEVFVRSFKDSDGDGVGDLPGLMSELDYIQALGADTVWLMPTFPSPSDHGYDVVDFDHTREQYGGDAALDALIAELHRRGMYLVMDVPINHSSVDHPWFQAALGPDSAERDRYRWSEEDPGSAGWWPSSGGWYYGHFSSGMPDLNWDTPAIREDLVISLQGWLDRGVDGFRIDAARHLVEEGAQIAEHPGTFCVIQGLRRTLGRSHPDALLVGEVWTNATTLSRYLDDGTEDGEGADLLPAAFDFPTSEGLVNTLKRKGASSLAQPLGDRQTLYPDAGMMFPFLTNHDMDRIATVVGGDLARLKIGAALLMALEGTPALYYGEEIGMTGVRVDGSDNGRRTPMQWSAEGPGYGFSTVTPWYPVNPDVAQINVEAALADPDSLLHTYRRLVSLRGQHPALRAGEERLLTTNRGDVVALLRRDDAEAILVLVNLVPVEVGPVTVDLAEVWPEGGWSSAEDLIGHAGLQVPPPATSWTFPTLPPSAYTWLALE